MKTAPFALLTALVLPAACAPPPGAPDQPAPAEGSTFAQARAADDQPGKFERVDTLGDACDDGSATSAISPDGQAFTTIFSKFVAAAGPNTPPEQASRGCLLLARVEVPAGWQYSVESLDYRGFVALEDDVTAKRSSLYIISGKNAKVPPPVEFEGEIEERGLRPLRRRPRQPFALVRVRRGPGLLGGRPRRGGQQRGRRQRRPAHGRQRRRRAAMAALRAVTDTTRFVHPAEIVCDDTFPRCTGR